MPSSPPPIQGARSDPQSGQASRTCRRSRQSRPKPPGNPQAAFEGAHGVFLVTNFWEEGTDELKQATAAVRGAKDAGVKHFVWSTLPDVEAISGGKFHVPHFTGKAKIDRIVKEAGFVNHTFVIAPMYYQGLWALLLRKSSQTDPSGGLFLLDPDRALHSHGRP